MLMKWLETIKIEVADGQGCTIERELAALVDEIRRRVEHRGLLEAGLYNHALIPGCFAIYLFWETEYPMNQGSMLGIRLTQPLKALGLVNHVVWIGKE